MFQYFIISIFSSGFFYVCSMCFTFEHHSNHLYQLGIKYLNYLLLLLSDSMPGPLTCTVLFVPTVTIMLPMLWLTMWMRTSLCTASSVNVSLKILYASLSKTLILFNYFYYLGFCFYTFVSKVNSFNVDLVESKF